MNIENSIALVTGANRVLGKAYTDALLAAGVAKVYTGARDPASVAITDSRLVPVKLDVTQDTDVHAAATLCADVNLSHQQRRDHAREPYTRRRLRGRASGRNGSERLRNAAHGARLCTGTR